METFVAAGVIGLIEGGHIGGRGSGDWKSGFLVRVPRADGGCDNLPATAPEAQAFYRQFFPALAGHLKARGWDKRYRQHLADEPINENAASYRDIARLVHETAPGIRVIEATQTRALVGAVNTWVPILDHLHRDYDFLRQRQEAGDEVWFYTCCGPTGSYANRFIEQPLIKPRLLHWINFRYGVTGYLHWGFNCWEPGHSPFDETTFRWPGRRPMDRLSQGRQAPQFHPARSHARRHRRLRVALDARRARMRRRPKSSLPKRSSTSTATIPMLPASARGVCNFCKAW